MRYIQGRRKETVCIQKACRLAVTSPYTLLMHHFYSKTKSIVSAALLSFCMWLSPFAGSSYAYAQEAVNTAVAPAAPAVVKADKNHVWIRAKLEYKLDSVLYGIDDNAIEFADKENWKKSGDWFYYSQPVEPGDKIRLMNGFSIPTSWNNETSQKGFKIIATVEASQAFPGDTEWNSNEEACYHTTFDVWKSGYTGLQEDETITAGTIKLNVVEYQLDENGKEVPYQNNKMVTPGQEISKIIEVQVEGTKGKIWQLIKPGKPTGDASNMILWGTAAGAGVCVLAVCIYRKRKKA